MRSEARSRKDRRELKYSNSGERGCSGCLDLRWIAALRHVRTPPGNDLRLLPPGDLTSDHWDELAAVVHDVLVRVEAANKEGGHADVIVVEQRSRDGLRRADERGGTAAGIGSRCGRGPEAAIVDLSARRDGEQTLAAGVRRR